MTNEEKAALLAAGVRSLAYYETGMDEALNDKNFDFAWAYKCKYSGAANMLKELGLWSYAEYSARCMALFNRFMAAKNPGYRPPEEDA